MAWDDLMDFKCNFCSKLMPVRLYGEDVIKCTCGAVYHKQTIVTLTPKAGARHA
jgi:hypothetical protein